MLIWHFNQYTLQNMWNLFSNIELQMLQKPLHFSNTYLE